MIFYIADTHFGHTNVIKYDKRPFKTAQEMDETIIKNWNEVVTDKDTVYILGDFSWRKPDETLKILKQLNGKKILIRGNHDKMPGKVLRQFQEVKDYAEIKDGDETVILSHYPMLFYNKQFHDTIHLYGHIHNSRQWEDCERWRRETYKIHNIPMRMFNVGCMISYMDYRPKTLQDILDKANPKEDLALNEYCNKIAFSIEKEKER